MRDLPMGEDVLMENELSDDYSIEEAAGDPDADAGFDEPDEVFEPEEILAEEAALDEGSERRPPGFQTHRNMRIRKGSFHGI